MHIIYLCSTYVSIINNDIIINENAYNKKREMYKHIQKENIVCFSIILRMYHF